MPQPSLTVGEQQTRSTIWHNHSPCCALPHLCSSQRAFREGKAITILTNERNGLDRVFTNASRSVFCVCWRNAATPLLSSRKAALAKQRSSSGERRSGCRASGEAGVKSEWGSQSAGKGSRIADIASCSKGPPSLVRSAVEVRTSAQTSDMRLK
jgi:hypothetical protein